MFVKETVRLRAKRPRLRHLREADADEDATSAFCVPRPRTPEQTGERNADFDRLKMKMNRMKKRGRGEVEDQIRSATAGEQEWKELGNQSIVKSTRNIRSVKIFS